MKKPDVPQRNYDIAVQSIFPGLTPNNLDRWTAGVKAIVLETFATGVLPSDLALVIRKKTEAGIPVFLVSRNPGDADGITAIRYVPLEEAVQAGAIPLEKVNVRHGQEILDAIQDETDTGKTGEALGEAVRAQFAYRPNEEKSPAEWDTPEGLSDLAQRRAMMERRLSRYPPL